MDRYESAALLDFVSTIVWPTRTVRIVTTPAGETTFSVIGSWDVANDKAMAWIDGNRVTGNITWATASSVILPVTALYGQQVILFVTPGAGTGYLPRSGLAAMLGDLNMGNKRLTALGASVLGSDAVRRDEALALINIVVGGNYVAKTGDMMTGDLKLGVFTDPASAVRRDAVALLNGSQPFTGKQAGVTTVDADPATTLTTKDYVLSKITAATGSFAPNRKQYFNTLGANTWTKPTGVSRAYILLRGGKGGTGGTNAGSLGGAGGVGGIAIASIDVTSVSSISLIVGPRGGNGATFSGSSQIGGGGGGGGGSTATVGANVLTAGGGGGGGAGAQGGAAIIHPSGDGGAGGVNGYAGGGNPWQAGALAGNNVTAGGGIGGLSHLGNGAGFSGTSGTQVVSGSLWLPDDDWMWTAKDLAYVNSGNAADGFAIIRWFEP